MTTTFYSPSLHRTCFLVLGCLFVLNCLVIFVIWEETLKRGSSSIKVPVDFGLCYKGLWPVEKAFALMWFFPQNVVTISIFNTKLKVLIAGVRSSVWLACVARLSVAIDRVLNHSLLSPGRLAFQCSLSLVHPPPMYM